MPTIARTAMRASNCQNASSDGWFMIVTFRYLSSQGSVAFSQGSVVSTPTRRSCPKGFAEVDGEPWWDRTTDPLIRRSNPDRSVPDDPDPSAPTIGTSPAPWWS